MSPNLEKVFPHAARAPLRELVATIDREMSQSSGPAEGEKNRPTDELRSSWAKLVDLLALGPAPEVRECPVCQQIGMRDATRCGYCWTVLLPVASAGARDSQSHAHHVSVHS